MELRKNPKQIIIRDAGPIRNHKKRHERKNIKFGTINALKNKLQLKQI